MSTPDPTLLTQSGNNWYNPFVYGAITPGQTLTFSFFDQNIGYPGYVSSSGTVFSSVVDLNSQFSPATVTQTQQDLIRYLLGTASSAVLGFADPHFRVSFSDVANIGFHENTDHQSGQILISDADVITGTDTGATTFSKWTTDTYTGTTLSDTYTLSFVPPSASNLQVFLAGVLQDPSTYSVSGDQLTFNTAHLPADVVIKISNGLGGDIVLDDDLT